MIRVFTAYVFVFMIVASAIVRAEPEATLKVAVSIDPQQYFVERIGGDRVEVDVMVPTGAEPHAFEPKPAQLAGLADADVYFAVGVTFERAWLSRFGSVNPDMRIVHTDKGIEKIPMGDHDHDHGEHLDNTRGHDHDGEHDHKEAGDHDHDSVDEHEHDSHGELDPHIWLSPVLVKVMAESMCRALVDLDPSGAEIYRGNCRALIADIDRLNDELTALFSPSRGKAFMVFHPAWGYFADVYGLEQVSVEVGGREPRPADLGRLITFARERDIRVVFVQPQFSKRSARTIADAIGGTVVEADPMAGDWFGNMLHVARAFGDALR